MGPDAFFPEYDDTFHRRSTAFHNALATVKNVCDTCDVRETCRDYAMRNDIRFGVWGGFAMWDRNERSAARKEQQ